ncbi:MAG: mechanosensitive ion channel family protein [Cyanobacteria bacterium SZAS LIN-3]|nr:mechanosensitive ion channel family protein [Cyanobacteria bacterium SZAS LIN-3]
MSSFFCSIVAIFLALAALLPCHAQGADLFSDKSSALTADKSAAGSSSDDDQSAAVVFQGKRLLIFRGGLDGFSAKERAQRTTQAIERLNASKDFLPEMLKLRETADGTEVVYGNEFIATMTMDDAKRAQSSTQLLASEFAAKLRIALMRQSEPVTPYSVARGVGLTIGASILMLIVMGVLGRVAAYVGTRIESYKGTAISGVRIQKAELLSAAALCNILHTLNKVAHLATFMIALYIYLIAVFNSFAATKWLALALRDTALVPLTTTVEALIGYLPKGMAIVVIAVLTYAIIAFADFFFDAIKEQQISFSGFDPEWAHPTYQLVRAMILAFALVAALPYAPFGESESFKQVGFLVGILVSLGSTSVIGNVMAGTVLTYTKAFKVGDRIKIGDTIGDVQDKSLFVTRLCTTKNEIVSIPNGYILNTSITNFSSMGKGGQLIVHTGVTIGYGEPWRHVHELLIAAALATDGIVPEPAPFVLQTALSDFYVCYEINAYSNAPHSMPRVYSDLHANIQDKFNAAGVEIMSAHYGYLRDGNKTTIPDQNLPADYKAPTFVFSSTDKRG